MKLVDLTYSQFLDIVAAKGLFLQFSETPEKYLLFAIEANISWECTVIKGTSDAEDFEDNHKSSANKPLEYRSTDGLLKTASAKFADVKNLWLDGEAACADVEAGGTSYMRRHFDFEFTLSGVDCRWYDCNFGDYIDFSVGFYTDVNDESTFTELAKFSNQYQIYKDGSRLFDVPTVKVIPEKVPGTDYDIYIRAKIVNVGSSPSKVVLNLVGWR